MKKKIFASIIIASIAIPSAISCKSNDNSCHIIKNNYFDYIYNTTNVDEYIAKPVSEIRKELINDKVNGIDTYKFDGIDYDTDYSRSSWDAARHLSKTLKIAIVAEYRNSDELRDIAKKLTYQWVFSNYHNINWWQNELGANNTLANLGIITFDYLGKKGQDAFNGKIRESSLKWRPSLLTHTGANVFDYIDITCRNAAINNDKEEMDIAFNRLKEEIVNNKREGFQEDGSFFQHGRQVQNVSYGKSVIRVARTLYKFKGTNYHMPDDKMSILSNYVLKGLRASTFKGYTNYTTVSREYTRVNNLDTQANGFTDLAYFIGTENYPGKSDTYYYVDSLNKRKNAIKENKIDYFKNAKMIVANIGHEDGKEGIYISYKATEPNLTNTECVNGENRLGLNLSYGTNTCVMDKGDEYFNIAPYMDYNYMPGSSSPMYYNGDFSNYTFKTGDATIQNYAENVYGDSLYENKVPSKYSEDSKDVICIYNDGQKEYTDEHDLVTYSMTKTRHHERGKYTVTCFATNKGMVLVGSDLNYTPIGTEEGVDTSKYHTTVDQYITSDSVGTKAPITSTQSYINHQDKIDDKIPGNVKYTSLVSSQNLVKNVESRTIELTDWARNNRDIKTDKSTPIGTKNIATISIDTSSTNNSYAYAIEPYNGTGGSNFECLAHSSKVHAIKADGKIMAAFYDKDGAFGDGDKYKLDDDEIREFEQNPDKGFFKIFTE